MNVNTKDLLFEAFQQEQLIDIKGQNQVRGGGITTNSGCEGCGNNAHKLPPPPPPPPGGGTSSNGIIIDGTQPH